MPWPLFVDLTNHALKGKKEQWITQFLHTLKRCGSLYFDFCVSSYKLTNDCIIRVGHFVQEPAILKEISHLFQAQPVAGAKKSVLVEILVKVLMTMEIPDVIICLYNLKGSLSDISATWTKLQLANASQIRIDIGREFCSNDGRVPVFSRYRGGLLPKSSPVDDRIPPKYRYGDEDSFDNFLNGWKMTDYHVYVGSFSFFTIAHSLTPELCYSFSSLTPSLPHSFSCSLPCSLAPLLPCSLASLLPHSLAPLLPHSLAPVLPHSLTPLLPCSLAAPSLPHSSLLLLPSLHFLTPSLSLTPSLAPLLIPSLTHSLLPSLTLLLPWLLSSLTINTQLYPSLRYPAFGCDHEGGIQFKLWPKTRFVDDYKLSQFYIIVKIYSAQIHLHKSMKDCTLYSCDLTRTSQADRAVNHLKNFDKYIASSAQSFAHADTNEPINWILRNLTSYRVEFSVYLNMLPPIETMESLYHDLQVAITHLTTPISVRFLSYEDLMNKREGYLHLICHDDRYKWHTTEKKEKKKKDVQPAKDSEGKGGQQMQKKQKKKQQPKRTLTKVCHDRLSLLRSLYGIADTLTCKYMKQMPEYLAAKVFLPNYPEIEALEFSKESFSERQHQCLLKHWPLTLDMCKTALIDWRSLNHDNGLDDYNEHDVFAACKDLYHGHIVKFRWQPRQVRFCRFITYCRIPAQRTPAFDSPADLLVHCALLWLQHLREERLFCGGQKGESVTPVIVFEGDQA